MINRMTNGDIYGVRTLYYPTSDPEVFLWTPTMISEANDLVSRGATPREATDAVKLAHLKEVNENG